ncbi:phosphatidylglycerophosphatase and protein-tyrosine phosphatase 1-like isoform X2 [Octopus sinensis]|uniref:Phosphatidylglycerophosphatase and protein-tyrosine phosphatase 1 n=1 Tax=Octopus sinensis TaxID=2607531 RepID=A0A7E6FGT8_9MOLL|nr:phosphatidylglycerophosphatase and protein-tyrosine phosphatase 1-like isoform X2 [Octopus sinensis]
MKECCSCCFGPDADLNHLEVSRKKRKKFCGNMPWIGSYVFSRVAFYPSLFYNYCMSKVSSRNWYDRIDETVILGALPLRPIAKTLINQENVRGIISANLDHEIKHFTPTEEEWRQMGVEYLRLKIVDFVGTPSHEQISEALDCINRYKKKGKSVYIHCKAGRTRSATIVACYLIKANGWDDLTAWQHIVSCRAHVRIFNVQKEFLHQFYLSNKNLDDPA